MLLLLARRVRPETRALTVYLKGERYPAVTATSLPVPEDLITTVSHQICVGRNGLVVVPQPF
jgi:hypothetical protein